MMNLTRSIGVSNFNLTQMQRLWDNSKIKPAVLQIEVCMSYFLYFSPHGLSPPEGEVEGCVRLG